MFTGLIESVGSVRGLRRSGAGARLEVDSAWPDHEAPREGDSIAVNGACLTAVQPTPRGFAADLSPETVRRTRLAQLRPGERVNLERALKLGDRLGGHIVQGHVDAITTLLDIRSEGGFQEWRMALPGDLAEHIAVKGSVALDGVSLTVANLSQGSFSVALIPETLAATTLGDLRVGASLHLETDVLAKYVARRLSGADSSLIDTEFGPGNHGA